MIDEVYLDMDGVLTNWDYQVDYYSVRKPNGKADWDMVSKIGSKFWIDMPWLLDGHRLYNGILNLQKQYNFKLGIMSAIFSKSGKVGKRYWLEQNCPEINPDNIIICDRAFQKIEHAKPNRLLIDDKIENCQDFVNNDGHAILFTVYTEVLHKLEEMLKHK
jgi:hypothetical protein